MTAAPVLGTVGREAVVALVGSTDGELGVRLLRDVPTNESRSEAELTRHSSRATAYGVALADRLAADGADGLDGAHGLDVVEVGGGLRERVLARYDSRRHLVQVYTDTVAYCEALVDELGWRGLFPAGTVRRAAVEHERAHHLVTADRSTGLREALDHTVLRIGRWRRLAYIAGADEVAAHAFSARTLHLQRSMLLLSTAAAAALGSGAAHVEHTPSED